MGACCTDGFCMGVSWRAAIPEMIEEMAETAEGCIRGAVEPNLSACGCGAMNKLDDEELEELEELED